MRRILMISPVPTHPADAGNRARVLSLSTILREIGHDVYFMHVEQEAGDAQAMRTNWGDRYIPVEYTWQQSVARTSRAPDCSKRRLGESAHLRASTSATTRRSTRQLMPSTGASASMR